jgi:hypothetical protein
MLENMPSTLFLEWLHIYRSDPWGEEFDDYRFGVVASLIANQWRGKGDRAKQPGDFFNRLKLKRRKQTVEEMSLILRSLAGVEFGK